MSDDTVQAGPVIDVSGQDWGQSAPQESPQGNEAPPPAPEAADEAEAPQEAPEAEPARGTRALRQRAQAAEAERDALAAHLTTVRQAVAEQAMARALKTPGAAWKLGLDVNSLFDQGGHLDPDAAREAAEQLRDTYGLESARTKYIDPGAGGTNSGGPIGSVSDAVNRYRTSRETGVSDAFGDAFTSY